MVPDNAPSPITTTSDETIVATLTPKQPQLSKIELGKLRRQYITQGPFEEVIACGESDPHGIFEIVEEHLITGASARPRKEVIEQLTALAVEKTRMANVPAQRPPAKDV